MIDGCGHREGLMTGIEGCTDALSKFRRIPACVSLAGESGVRRIERRPACYDLYGAAHRIASIQ